MGWLDASDYAVLTASAQARVDETTRPFEEQRDRLMAAAGIPEMKIVATLGG